jgi:hypothetical protein
MPLTVESLHTGLTSCQYCRREFEATVFEAREHQHQSVQVAAATPDGAATACANHPGNAAVTSCQRCGLFICALCDMNVGDGSYCPSCFDRVRAEGSLRGAAKRRADYAMLARVAVLLGLMPCFYGVPAALGVWWAAKGISQRRREGVSAKGMIFALILAILELLTVAAFVAFMIYAIIQAPSPGTTTP